MIQYIQHSQAVETLVFGFFISFLFLFSILINEYIKKNKKGKAHGLYTRKLNECLISLTRNQIFFAGNLVQAGKELTTSVSEYMTIDRVSIWLYNKDKTSIVCDNLYIKSENKHYYNLQLFKHQYADYFEHLDKDPIIIANNAEIHPATSCFTESYLKPNGIKSMLDVPIYINNNVIGVICLENLSQRDWQLNEINFVQLLSSLFSFAYSVKEINRINKDFFELENFIDNSVLISKADANGKITYVNDKFTKVSGYNLEEVIGKDHSIVNSGYHSRQFWVDMYKTVLKDKRVWNGICTNKSKDGNLYYVDSYIKAYFDENDKLTGFMSIRYDVSDIKRKELDIRNRMNAINHSNAVIEFDKDGYIKFANAKFCEIMGYESKELIGQHHKLFVTIEESNSQEYSKFWNDLSQGEYISSQFTRIKKSGDTIWLQATYNPILDNNGEVIRIMKIATDVSEKVLQSLVIEKKNTYLEHAAKILRHDMHSGINTYIPRGINSLERRLSEQQIKDLKIEAPLKMIKDGLKHTQKVYKGVYEFTNLVKKDVTLNKSNFDLSLILKDYLSATAYGNQVIFEDLGSFEVNDALFCTAIDNLIRNGLKYNDSNSKFVKIYRKKDILYVEDNGRGMSSDEFEILKRPYTRRQGQKESGSGLGLNICIAILEEHGFIVSCDKLKKGGTQLKIKLKN